MNTQGRWHIRDTRDDTLLVIGYVDYADANIECVRMNAREADRRFQPKLVDNLDGVVARLGLQVRPEWVKTQEQENVFVTRVLREEGVTRRGFTILDEKPGLWGYDGPFGEWHSLLRRWRNTSTRKQREDALR